MSPLKETITSDLLQSTFSESIKLVEFLTNNRASKNEKSGQYSLAFINKLFGNSWKDKKKIGGHKKLQHRVTNVIVEYSSHKDPTDIGAVKYIAEQIQKHINIFNNDILYPQKDLKASNGTYDFKAIAEKLNKMNKETMRSK